MVACSSGNHGRAVAYVAGRLGVPATVYVPEWVDPVKLRGIEAAGAEARREGATFDESEALAVERAQAHGRTYVPAALVIPLSGGGLAGGIAAALDRMPRPRPEVVAVSAEKASVMLASIQAGRPVELPEEETLANALAGGIGLDNAHSFALVRDTVDRHVTVTEDEIAEAMRYALTRLRVVVEGGGAVGLAAWLASTKPGRSLPDGPVVIVLSGGNVAPEVLARVLGGVS